MDATSRYFLIGLLTLFDLLSDVFMDIWFGTRALGVETFEMVLLLSPFPVGLLVSLNLTLISFLNSNCGTLCELGTLLTIWISIPFCSWFVFTALFWTFWSWALFTPLFTPWFGLWFPTVLFTFILGILYLTVLFTLWLETLLYTYFGKPFLLVASVLPTLKMASLAHFLVDLSCALGTTFGIPASFKCILFLCLSPSGVDTTYNLGVSVLDLTTALYYCLVKVFCNHTYCLGRNFGSSLAWASWLVKPCLVWKDALIDSLLAGGLMMAGRVIFSCLLCNNSPGEGNLLSIGVALSCSKA